MNVSENRLNRSNSDTSLQSAAFHSYQLTINWGEIVGAALAEGGDWCDIFWEKKYHNKNLLHDKALRELSHHIDEGISIRVLLDGRQYSAFTNILTPDNILKTAKVLAQGVRQGIKGQFTLPSLTQTFAPHVSQLLTDKVSDSQVAEKLQLMREVEAPCWDTSLGIKHVKIYFLDQKRQTMVIRSDGKVVFDEQNQVMLLAEIFGQSSTGEMHRAMHRIGGQWNWQKFREQDPTQLASHAQRLIKVLYHAKPAPSGSLPVVLSGAAGGVMCHEAVGHGLEADYAAEGLSAYSGKLGTSVANSKITVIDDGSVPFARGSQIHDDEGHLMQKTTLIENGVLKSFMLDQRMALKTGFSSTGNGRRESYRFPPQCRMTNTYIAAGPDDPLEILKDTKKGLYVTTMGGGQVDSTSGDFVFEVKEAYLIRDGEICEAVRGATLTGNGPKVLQEVDRVGNDVGFDIGTCGKSGQWVPVTDGQPTLRVPSMAVGGSASIKDYF
jgi:TldD protein